MSGCPFIKLKIILNGFDSSLCSAFVTKSLAWLDREPHAIIIMAAANEDIADHNVTLVSSATGQHASSQARKAVVWRDGLESTIRALQGAGDDGDNGFNVATLHNSRWQFWSPSQCQMLTLLQNTSKCGLSLPLADASQKQRLALASEREAARSTGAQMLDLRHTVCPHEICLTNDGNEWIYRDGLHISTTESEQLAQTFADEIRRGSQSRHH